MRRCAQKIVSTGAFLCVKNLKNNSVRYIIYEYYNALGVF